MTADSDNRAPENDPGARRRSRVAALAATDLEVTITNARFPSTSLGLAAGELVQPS
jgi:hypothetical protein